jgi:hypothetical protein
MTELKSLPITMPTYLVYLKDKRMLKIKAKYFMRSFEGMNFEFFESDPKPKVMPTCTVKASLVEYILMEGSAEEFDIESGEAS